MMALHAPVRRKRSQRSLPPLREVSSPHQSAWKELALQDRVTVVVQGETPYAAIVDDMTADATVVWVLATTMSSRRAFHYTDAVEILHSAPVRRKLQS